MKKFFMATVLCVSFHSTVLQADELLTRYDLFIADELRYSNVNEYGDRTGVMEVKGALIASPCILETTEIEFPLKKKFSKGNIIYPLSLHLRECGYGENHLSNESKTSVVLTHNALIIKGGVFQSDLKISGSELIVLQGGSGYIHWDLNENQQKLIQPAMLRNISFPREKSDAVIRLHLNYE